MTSILPPLISLKSAFWCAGSETVFLYQKYTKIFIDWLRFFSRRRREKALL